MLDARAAGTPVPGFWWRTLAPIAAVPLALLVALVLAVALAPTPLGDRSRAVIAGLAASALILVLALALRAALPRHLAHWSTAVKHTWGGAVGLGVVVAAGLLVATVSIVALASAIDPSAERHLDDLRDEVGLTAWQKALTIVALVVLAPLGEELLFRGLLLRALVRRLNFWPAAVVSGLVFAVCHLDQYVPWPLWPRTITLAGTGVVLAWLYRWRGYPASVSAHAAVNLGAAIALLASD
jgi:membrane protease YdiL (CAAX protease family)